MADSDAYSAQEAPRLESALSAMAELIDASRDVERRAGPDREPRLRAALARVKGA